MTAAFVGFTVWLGGNLLLVAALVLLHRRRVRREQRAAQRRTVRVVPFSTLQAAGVQRRVPS